MNRLICRILSFVFLVTSCVPASWAQTVRARSDEKRPSWIEKTVQTAVQTAQKAHNFSLAQQELDEAFDYQDIAKKLSTLHQLYNARYQEQEQKRQRQQLQAQLAQQQVHPNDAIPAVRQPVIPQAPKKSKVLELISTNKMTPEALLNFIDPLDPDKADWQESSYAAQALANTLITTQETYPGLENYLRQAQMRVLYRLSKTDLTGNVSNVEINAVGQLRVTMMALHLCYQRLFGKDPLAEYKSATARTPQQWVGNQNGKFQEANQRRALNVSNLFASTAEVNIYEKIRASFMREIRHWKNDLPNDTYTATKLIRTLQGRNQTSNFSIGEAAGDIVVNDILFFIPMIKGLGEWMGITGDDTKTPVARLSAMAPLAVEYDLLDGNFEHIKTVVQALEPQKLGESTFNREAIFKNDDMYQSTQPAVVEIFNTIYVYALTPGRTQMQWFRAMDLLHHFANPYEYSIMTRLAAISTAAKLMDLQNMAANPSPFEEAQGNTQGIEHLKNFSMPNQNYLNKMDLSKFSLAEPGTFGNPNYKYQLVTGNKPYAYAESMAQYVVDIYALLKKGHLAGMQDYGLGADQTKAAEDGLAKLYNIFQRNVVNKERYPQIMPRGRENVEQRMEYNGKAYKEPVLHTYGARVRTSGGGTVDMYLDNALQSHFDKDAGEFCSTLAVDIITWKFLVSVVRVAGKGIKLAKGLVMPKGSKLVLSSQFSFIGNHTARAAKAIRVDQTAFKAGINAADPQAQAVLKNAQELANLSIPDAATATRAEVCRFLGIAEDASETTFKKALTKMKAKYHPDHFEKYITPQMQKALSEKAGSLAALGDFANPAGKAAAKAGTSAAQAAQGPKLLTNTATEEATRWEKMADTAKARAAQVPQGPVDYNSWTNVTKGFAKFFAVDYALSYLNLPLEDHMQKIAADDAEKQYKPQIYDNTQAPKDPKPADGSPTEIFDNISAAVELERGGAILRLPINLGKMALGSDVLGADERARMAAAMREKEFANASIAGRVEKFNANVNETLEKLSQEKEKLLQNNASLIAAVSTAKDEINQLFNTYETALQKANVLARSNLQQAQENAQAALQQFAQNRSEILTRCVKSYWPAQATVLTKQYLQSLRENYGKTSVSAQDEAQTAQIYRNYVAQKQAIQTQWFSLLVHAQDNLDAMEALNKQTLALETTTQRALGQIGLRIGLDVAIANLPTRRTNFLWHNQNILMVVPSAQKDLKQLYSTYGQDLKRARGLVETNLDEAQNLTQQATTKFSNSQADIMVNTVKFYWAQMEEQLIVSYTNQLQQQFINELSIPEMGKLQSLIKAYTARSTELAVQFWQASKDPETALNAQTRIRQEEEEAAQHLDTQVEALVNRIQRRFDADPWLSFVQALYIEAAKDLNEAFPWETYAYSPVYSQVINIYKAYLADIQAALQAIDPDNPDQDAFTAAKTAAQQKRNSGWNQIKGHLQWEKSAQEWERQHPVFDKKPAPTYTPVIIPPYRPSDQLGE